ncbi:MAG: hypothetical protein AAF480_11325 [Actinomycetota bacterium]
MRTATRHRPTGRPRATGWWLLGATLFAGAFMLYGLAALRGEATGHGLIAVPVVGLLAIPLLSHARRSEDRFDLAGIVFAAIGAKLCATYCRFWMVDSLYDGVGDSTTYHLYGSAFAPLFRNLDFDVDPGRPVPGTGFIRVLTGVVYAVVGSDRFVGFIVFGLLAFIGSWFFYKAFVTAAPYGEHKRYAILIFFWPSLLFWPSAIGKEAWMIACLGLASWGAASIYARRPRGYALFALGVLGAAMPRPHIAIVVIAAAGVGLVVTSLFHSRRSTISLGSRVVASLFLLVLGSILAPRLATFLNVDDVGGSGFSESLDTVLERTSQGGSGFDPATISSPLDYPRAFITVLFRPFPFEATSISTIITAAEGTLLLGLTALSLSRLARLPSALVRNAYVAYASAFTFMFCYVFAFIANFGILARQRAQVLPFLFILLALPALTDRRSMRGSGRTPGPAHAAPRTIELVDAPVLAPPRARA